jgi:hypothetical protein
VTAKARDAVGRLREESATELEAEDGAGRR